MDTLKTYLAVLFFGVTFLSKGQQLITIYGRASDASTNKPLPHATVRIQNSTYGTSTDQQGNFTLIAPARKHLTLLYHLLSYTTKIQELDLEDNQDSIHVSINLSHSYSSLDTVSVYAAIKPDTLVGSPRYSIYDFDFYEDKFILLTAEKTLEKAELKLANESGNILTTYFVPKEGGEAKEFYRDYMGYTNLVCKNYVYRITLYHDRFLLTPLEVKDVNAYLRPILDTLNGKLIFTDYWKEYPLFNYLSFTKNDSSRQQLHTVEDKDLMHAYNFEYYALKPRDKLEARRLAMDLKTDKHITAALMSGFTQSLFYEPLFAPLFIVKDTISIFDHYKDKLYHLDKYGHKLDSIPISYNHPKNWKDWKHLMLKDDVNDFIYAVYERNGHKYVKQISSLTGKDLGKYTLQFHSAHKLKVRNGYVYYIYRPFESTQQKFFYRELITLEKKE